MSKKENVLIFEAHSDDCVIGMGGTVQYLKNLGYNIVLITFTTGETAYSSVEMKEKIAPIRKKENERALSIIGVDRHLQWDHKCQDVKDTRAVHQQCIEEIRKYCPKYIFTHYSEDKHRDHRAISSTVSEAWWKSTEGVLADRGEPFRADSLYYFETTELFTHPDTIIPIELYFEKKRQAVEQYKSQVSVMGEITSYVEGLAQVRGLLAEGKYGEAFVKSNFFPSTHF